MRSVYARHGSIVLSYVAALVLLVVVSIIRPGFGLGGLNPMLSLALEASVIGLVALGQTFVILSGGVDLSLPWVLTGAAVMMTVMTNGVDAALPWAVPVTLLLCLGVGFVNGIGITVLRVSPVIMTLAMNGILLGAMAGLVSGGAVTYGKTPPMIVDLVASRWLGIPSLVWIVAALAVLTTILLSFTSFGRRLYAVGTSPEVSLYSGIHVRRVTIAVYMLSAFSAGLAGIILSGKFGRAYLGMGDPYLFMSVAAVVIGGASISGGRGHYLGTLGGALLLAVLTATIPVLALPRAFQLMLYGFVVLIAVFFASRSGEER